MFSSKEIVETVRKRYPVGCRVRLVKMDDVQAPPIGTLGTVYDVDDAMYDGYLDTWNIATRSEEERIEEFLEENDALLKNRDKIPFKYISDIHYGKKTVWKNPDFEN